MCDAGINGKYFASQRYFALNDVGTSIAAVAINTSYRSCNARITRGDSGITSSTSKKSSDRRYSSSRA